MILQQGWDSKLCNQIKRAACFLFQSKGFDNTSVNDLIGELNIESQTFFFYFRSMDELLEVVWSES